MNKRSCLLNGLYVYSDYLYIRVIILPEVADASRNDCLSGFSLMQAAEDVFNSVNYTLVLVWYYFCIVKTI